MRNKKGFSDAEGLQRLIDKYFLELEPQYTYDDENNIITDKNGVPVMTDRKPATISSMAYSVGLSSKEELMSLRKKRTYSYVLERALLRMEAYTEMMLFDKSAATGAKFLLQSSFGWTEEENSGGAETGVVILSETDDGGDFA